MSESVCAACLLPPIGGGVPLNLAGFGVVLVCADPRLCRLRCEAHGSWCRYE